ncbi:MAG: amino acid ABC transporter substrate-binding protein [Candidatus Bipolaricaulota bacterium]|nr:amino acid ABC transporter substrate-binding protein [Candidatus Bipolaricaulota bacterium]
MARLRLVRWFVLDLLVVGMLAGTAFAATGGGVLGEIASTGVFRVGLRSDVRPFAYVDELGRPAGFCVDMALLLTAKLSEYAGRPVEMQVVPITSTNRLDKVASGEAMIEMGASTHNATRDVVVDFSLPYFLSETSFMVRASGGIVSLADLAGKTVCAARGTSNLPALEAAVADGRVPASLIEVADSHEQGVKWLRDGKVDAYFTDTVLLQSLRASWPKPADFVVVQESIHTEPYGWILPEDDSDWRDFVDNFLIWTLEVSCAEEVFLLDELGIMSACRDGEWSVFDAVYDKWFGPLSATPIARSAQFDALLATMQWPDVLEVWPGSAGK